MSSFSRMERVSESPSSPGIMMSSTMRSILPACIVAPRRRGVLGDARAEPVLHEIAGEEIADVAMVVDDEDMRRGLHGRELTRSPPGAAKENCNGLYRSAGAAKTATKPVFPDQIPATSARQCPAREGDGRHADAKKRESNPDRPPVHRRLDDDDTHENSARRRRCRPDRRGCSCRDELRRARLRPSRHADGHDDAASATSCCRTSTPTTTARCRRTRSTRRSMAASPSSTPTRTASLSLQEFQALVGGDHQADRRARLPVPRSGRRCGDRQGGARPTASARSSPISTRTPTACSRRPTGRITAPARTANRSGERPRRHCGAAPCGRIA